MKTYAERKEEARQEAIEWQASFDEHNYSYQELVDFAEYFTKLGNRYGLIREFYEQGII